MLFTGVDGLVDGWAQEEGWRLVRGRQGIKPRCCDSEVLTLEVVRDPEGQSRKSGRITYRHARAGYLW